MRLLQGPAVSGRGASKAIKKVGGITELDEERGWGLCVERRDSFLYYRNSPRCVWAPSLAIQSFIHVLGQDCWHRRIQPLTPSLEMLTGGRDSILSLGGRC